MKSLRLYYLLCLLIPVALFTACDDDDPEIDNEEEVITTLIYTLTPDGGGAPVVMTFRDLDGDGGNAPTITGGTLQNNTNYSGALTLTNETETPAEDITAEVRTEDDEHQFFFSVSNDILTVTYGDMDGNSNPLGLVTTVATTNTGNTDMTIVLRHEPDKSAAGVADGDITNAGGETDIEVTFPVVVQ